MLSVADLPLAELGAARLDGEVFGLAEGYLPVDLPVDASARAASVRAIVPHERLIAEQHSAAWIWGVLDAMPRPHRLAAAIGARVSRRSSPWLRVREVVIDEADQAEIGGLSVTTPLRTVLDLVRAAQFGPVELEVVGRLMDLGGFRAAECLESIRSRRNLPHKHEATARLMAIASAQPEFTRYTS